jgi:hypothetical protein
MSRQPTDVEYAAYDGMHCHGLWRTTPESWRCPCCNRSKRGILQWGQRVGSNAKTYGPVGWKAGLHKHHDHGSYRRFPQTLICGACNAADGRAKRSLGLSADFSFSPSELRQMISAADNQPVIVDLNMARQIYETGRYSNAA